MNSIDWYRNLIDAATKKSHVFWHTSPLNTTCNLVRDLAFSVGEEKTIDFLDCTSLPLDMASDLDQNAIRMKKCDYLMILNFDRLLSLSHGRSWMRQLRPAVISLLENGTRVIVASGRPQNEFPAIDGSSLATDCLQYFSRRLTESDVLPGPEWTTNVRAIRDAAGLHGPVSELLDHIDPGGKSYNRELLAILKNAISKTMTMCGPEAISWLEEVILMGGERDVSYDTVPVSVGNIIQGSGLACIDHRSDIFKILPGISAKLVSECITRAEIDVIDAPRVWQEIAGLIFKFERMARKIFLDHIGSERNINAQLEVYSEKIRRNYSSECGIAAPKLAEITNPIRWIELSDLFDLLISGSENLRIAGWSNKRWVQAKSDILPLRNKIQHMRLPSEGDKELVARYVRSLSGGLNRSESV